MRSVSKQRMDAVVFGAAMLLSASESVAEDKKPKVSGHHDLRDNVLPLPSCDEVKGMDVAAADASRRLGLGPVADSDVNCDISQEQFPNV